MRATFRQDLKELKLRPSTDVHDYQVRLRAAQKFLAKVGSLERALKLPRLPVRVLFLCSGGLWSNALRACGQGDKVKLSLQFRGREIEMQSIGRDLFQVRSDRSLSSSDCRPLIGLMLTPLCEVCRNLSMMWDQRLR